MMCNQIVPLLRANTCNLATSIMARSCRLPSKVEKFHRRSIFVAPINVVVDLTNGDDAPINVVDLTNVDEEEEEEEFPSYICNLDDEFELFTNSDFECDSDDKDDSNEDDDNDSGHLDVDLVLDVDIPKPLALSLALPLRMRMMRMRRWIALCAALAGHHTSVCSALSLKVEICKDNRTIVKHHSR